MEMGRFGRVLVSAITIGALFAAPALATKKKRAPKPPKVSLTCKSDDDCALTKMGDGESCPMLCQPRAVSKASADALEKYAATCQKNGKQCAVPECAPPRQAIEGAACVSGKCVAKTAAAGSRD